MSARSFRLIALLLGFCIAVILGLQAYWLNHFYKVKKDAFEKSVYAALNQTGQKVLDINNLKALQMTYFIDNGDTLVKTPSRHFTIKTENTTRVMSSDKEQIQITELNATPGLNSGKARDSVFIDRFGNKVQVVLKSSSNLKSLVNTHPLLKPAMQKGSNGKGLEKELNALVNKLISEIKLIDREEMNADTLQGILKKTLQNNGVFLPFEFSMQKIEPGKKSVLAQSKAFNDKDNSYRWDFSARQVLNSHHFLLLQFPGSGAYVFSGIKNMLLLSLVFSLIIIGVFYYTLHLILKQKKLSDIKTDFVNNMTHELKTPIATIALATDAIGKPQIKENAGKFEEYTRILKEENKKLNLHVERVLQMALLDKGNLRLQRVKLDLAELVQRCIDGYRLQIEQKKAQVTFLHEGPLPFFGDETHLLAVFNNLLDNALKYSGERCEVSIHGARNKDELELRFNDNGVGIDANKQAQVFEKFYRVSTGNLHDVKGFGLGLSYAKSIVEAHGGRISLTSQPGKGSQFIIHFKTYA